MVAVAKHPLITHTTKRDFLFSLSFLMMFSVLLVVVVVISHRLIMLMLLLLQLK